MFLDFGDTQGVLTGFFPQINSWSHCFKCGGALPENVSGR